MKVWNIKQFASETGVPPDTLRYYEKEGLLSPKRQTNGYRCYDEDDLALVKNIAVMKYACFTLAEMKNMGEIFKLEPGVKCNEVSKRMLNAKITELKQIVSNYQQLITLMSELLPMIETPEDYYSNKANIDGFINQIYKNIRGEN